MQPTSDPSPSRHDLTRWGKAIFLLAVVLTITLVVMGVTGTPWPRWLLALTNIL